LDTLRSDDSQDVHTLYVHTLEFQHYAFQPNFSTSNRKRPGDGRDERSSHIVI